MAQPQFLSVTLGHKKHQIFHGLPQFEKHKIQLFLHDGSAQLSGRLPIELEELNEEHPWCSSTALRVEG